LGTAEGFLMAIDLSRLRVQIWMIDRLLPYIRNARTHTDAQVAQVAASIREFGWTNPLLVAADGVIIAGHARLAAARKLRMTEVPVIVLDHLTDAQRRALVLADNRLALDAGWDEEMLRVELASLQEDGFDLEVVGFTDEELQNLLRDPEESNVGLTDEDAVPDEPERAITVVGDLWMLDDHKLLCGDATSMGAIQTVLAGGFADMAFTDPPYSVSYTGKTARKLTIQNDNLGAGFYDFLHEAYTTRLHHRDCKDKVPIEGKTSTHVHAGGSGRGSVFREFVAPIVGRRRLGCLFCFLFGNSECEGFTVRPSEHAAAAPARERGGAPAPWPRSGGSARV
jgi:ParB-like nuclease domain